jgi:hypothetical protein
MDHGSGRRRPPPRKNPGLETKLSPAVMSEIRKRLAELGRRLNRAKALSDRRAAARTIGKGSRVKK